MAGSQNYGARGANLVTHLNPGSALMWIVRMLNSLCIQPAAGSLRVTLKTGSDHVQQPLCKRQLKEIEL